MTNLAVADFPTWASQVGVQAVAGDFNGDGYSDIALTGVHGWGSIPVAFGMKPRPGQGKLLARGAFVVSNQGLANFPAWASEASVQAVATDMNGDHMADLVLSGGKGWTNVRIALSASSPTSFVAPFTVTTTDNPGAACTTPTFAAWAAQ